MVSYVDDLRRDLSARWPRARLVVFGHVADNNLHVVVNVGADTMVHAKAIGEQVYQGVASRNGSISAEHGIGTDKREALASHLPAPVLEQMRQLKRWMDPQGRLNPGKILTA